MIGGYYLDIPPNRDMLRVRTDDGRRAGHRVDGIGRRRRDDNVRGPRTLHGQHPLTRATSEQPAIYRERRAGPLASGGTVPLGEVASSHVPEDHDHPDREWPLVVYIFVDILTAISAASGGRSKSGRCHRLLAFRYYVTWSGQFEYLQRAEARLRVVVPLTLLIIFLLLYLNFGRITETLIVKLSLAVFADRGTLAAVVARLQPVGRCRGRGSSTGRRRRETGVVMLIYLDHALAEVKARRDADGAPLTREDLREAIMFGAVERVRPKMMTVVAIMAGLLPIMWSTGTGSK